MKRYLILPILFICISVFFIVTEMTSQPGNTMKSSQVAAPDKSMNLPLYFIENTGQLNSNIKYYEQSSGYNIHFTPDTIQSFLKTERGTATINLIPVGSNKQARIIGEEPCTGKHHIFTGNDSTNWHTDIPTYTAVRYQEIYKNIDLKFYGVQQQLKYDVLVQPGGDPAKIRFLYTGIDRLSLNDAGDLVIDIQGGSIIQQKPRIYQIKNGRKITVAGDFKIFNKLSYGFTVPEYDQRIPLNLESGFKSRPGQNDGVKEKCT